MPTVSVIIPSFNAERFLVPTMESVQAQDFDDWECVVVDDGSSDATFDIASRFAACDSRFNVIRQSNSGRALAIMAGLGATSHNSKYLFFLDSDDILEKSALSRMSSYLDDRPEVCIASCQAKLIDASGSPLEGIARSRWVPGIVFPRQLRVTETRTPFVTFYCATGQGPFAMHRRSVFEKTEGLDPRFSEFSLHEDTDIFCQMALLGEVHCLPERLYKTRRHTANVTNGHYRIQLAYARFREKWDSYMGRTNEQRRILYEARLFYYGTFCPCRNVKVGLKACREFLSSGDARVLRRAVQLFSEAAWDFIGSRVLSDWNKSSTKA